MNGLPPDPYRILGVPKDASQPDIRSAYKKLALKCHPDKVLDPALKSEKQDEFQKVQQAYELLNDENERRIYDDKVKVAELRAEAARHMRETLPKTPMPKTPTHHYAYVNVNIRNVEPRGSASPRFPPPPAQKVYQYHTTSHSYEDDMHTKSKAMYEDGPRRRASYEKPSKREEERREARRRKEREEEYQREQERRERDARRADKKRQEKERKRESDEKHRRKSPYVEPYEEAEADEVYLSRSEKKKSSSSSSKKHDTPREKSKGRNSSPVRHETDSTRKMQDHYRTAFEYMDRKGSKPGPPQLARSQTFPEPPTHASPIPAPSPPPQYGDDEPIYRSSARRRASHDIPLRSKDKPRRSPSREPVIIDVDRKERAGVPSLQKSHSTPPTVPDSPPRTHLPRANTTQEYVRPIPHPPQMPRSSTFHAYVTPDPEPRVRRGSHPVYYEDDSEDDRRRPAHHGRRTHSPEPIHHRTTYQVNDGKTQRMYPPEAESPTTRKSHKYVPVDVPLPSAGLPHHLHPSTGLPRDASYPYGTAATFSKVKTAKQFVAEDVTYSNIPHTSQRDVPYAYA